MCEENTRTPEDDNMTAEEAFALSELERLGVSFVRLTHPAAVTMELCRGIGAEYGAEHCKNLLLSNRSGNMFHLLLMDAEQPYRTSDVSKKLGVSRLSFASVQQLYSVLGLTPGCVSALGLLNDCAKQAYARGALRVAIDSDLLRREYLCVHPNVSTATLVVKTEDLLRLIASLGMEITQVDI